MSRLEEGIALVREGDHSGARSIFLQIIHGDPENEDAWLWLAWAAETKDESLRYFQEARALLPDSERIEEGLLWAKGQGDEPFTTVAQEDEKAPVSGQPPQEEESSRAEQVVSQVGRAAQVAHENAERALEGLQKKVSGIHAPKSGEKDLRGILVTLASVLVVATVCLFVLMGISRARNKASIVQALELPTLVVDATATPTIEQLSRPLWVQVDVAWTRGDWDTAIKSLELIRAIDSQNEDARLQLAEACYQRGLEFVEANELEKAGREFDSAIRLNAWSEELQQTRRELKMYLDGLKAYWAKDWQGAVENLRKVYEVNPQFRDTRAMLGKSWYGLGIKYQDDEVWDEARDAFERVTELLPDLEDAKVRLAIAEDVLIPPKRIEVDISDKLVTLYEHHQPIHVFSCCTGRSNSPTVPGRYAILDKMPEAYASRWALRMPWWLGIYYAGGSENGFHALPILSSGRTLWRGALGTACSYGCIVLDTDDAITMYNWADIGTVVLVRW
jgi:tetratricopeptide (TPR) repeat protein